jgi:hypothetical protein
MKRRGAEYVYNIIKDMTPQQELEYWRKQTELLRQRQAASRSDATGNTRRATQSQ